MTKPDIINSMDKSEIEASAMVEVTEVKVKKTRVKGVKRVAKRLTKKAIQKAVPIKDNKGKRRGGFYWEEGQPFLSVTTALSVINKEALMWWANKQVYWAMVLDPSLNEKEALAAPYRKSKKAMFRGTDVHAAVEHYKNTKMYLQGLEEPIKTYIKAFYNWVIDNDVEILVNEKSIISKKYGYAGTFDLLVRFRKSGRILIVDIKTGKDIYRDVFIQLSAYRAALVEEGVFEKLGIDVKDVGIAVCNLQTGQDDLPTGAYQFLEGDKDMLGAFLAAKYLWEMRNEEKIVRINQDLPPEKQYPRLNISFNLEGGEKQNE